MSDFLIMFLLYSCLSSVGCWSIEWRMRLKGGLSLHKQSSRVPGKSSFLTNKSGEVHYKNTMWNLWRWQLFAQWTDSCPWVAWQDRTAWSLVLMLLFRGWHWLESCYALQWPVRCSILWVVRTSWALVCFTQASGPWHVFARKDSFCEGLLHGCNAAPAELHIVWKTVSCDSPFISQTQPPCVEGQKWEIARLSVYVDIC